MIDKVSLSQYVRVESKDTQSRVGASRTSASEKSVNTDTEDQVAISEQAQKAEEVSRYTKMAQNVPAIDEAKVAALKKAVNKPGYLDSATKEYAVRIADRLVEALYAKQSTEKA